MCSCPTMKHYAADWNMKNMKKNPSNVVKSNKKKNAQGLQDGSIILT